MQALPMLAFVVIVMTAMVLLIFRDWRINAAALALQYLAAFALVTISWPVGMAVIKLIVGWMATVSIGFTCMRQQKSTASEESAASMFFRAVAGLLVILVIFILSPSVQSNIFPRLDLIIVQSGLVLLGMALMQLGTTSEPYLTIFGLLSLLSGFEIIHAGLERSSLLTGLLVLVNLGLALVGAYFVGSTSPKDNLPDEEEIL